VAEPERQPVRPVSVLGRLGAQAGPELVQERLERQLSLPGRAADREWLISLIHSIREFLWERLKLALHPDKVSIATLAFGIDVLGWVHFSGHRVLRTATRRRMLTRIDECLLPETVQSYLGLLKHGNTYTLQEEILRKTWYDKFDG
jgi:hypothetical protein